MGPQHDESRPHSRLRVHLVEPHPSTSRTTMAQRHDAVAATDTDLIVADLLTIMCIAVQQHASACHLCDDGDGSTEALLCQIYQDTVWTHPIERALSATSAWSLRQRRRSKGFQRDLSWSMTSSIATESLENDDDYNEEDEKAPQGPPVLQFVSPYCKLQRADTRWIPETFCLVRIDEDPLEARWDAHGRPVPLHCNILGDKYAPQYDPLRFLRHEASVSEIYSRMKHTVRRELQNRERQRIQALNDRERRRRQLEPSPEAALETKFDRMFQNNDNVPEEEKEALLKSQLGRGREFTQTV